MCANHSAPVNSARTVHSGGHSAHIATASVRISISISMSETRTSAGAAASAGVAAAAAHYRPSTAPAQDAAAAAGEDASALPKRSYPLPLYLHAHSVGAGGSGSGGGGGVGTLPPRVALAHDDSDGALGQLAGRPKLFVRPSSGAQTERLLRSGATTPLSLEQPALRGFVRLELGGGERRVVERGPAAADTATRDATPLSGGVVHRARTAAPEQPYIFLKTSASVASRPTERRSLWADRTAGLPPPSFAMDDWPGEEGEAEAEAEAKEAGATAAATARRKLAANSRPSTSPRGNSLAPAAAAAAATPALPSPADPSDLRTALLPAAPLSRGQPMGPPYLPASALLGPVLREGAHGGAVALAPREAPTPPYRPGASRREARAGPHDGDSGAASGVSPPAEEKESATAGAAEHARGSAQQRRRRADAVVPPSTAPSGTIVIPRRSHTAAASASASASASAAVAGATAAAAGPAHSRAGRLSPPRPYTTLAGPGTEEEEEESVASAVVDHFPAAPSARHAHRTGLSPRAGATTAAAAAAATAGGSVSARAAAPAMPAPSLTPRGAGPAGPAASGSSTARAAITIRPRSRPGTVPAATASAAALSPSPSPAAMAARIQQAVILLASRPCAAAAVAAAASHDPDQGQGQAREQEQESKSDATAAHTHLVVPYGHTRPGNRNAVEAALRRQRRSGQHRDIDGGDDFDGSGEEHESGDTVRFSDAFPAALRGSGDDGRSGDDDDGNDAFDDDECADPAAMLRAIDPATLGADHAALHAHLAQPGSILAGLVAAAQQQQQQGQAQSSASNISNSSSVSPNLAPNLAVVEAWLTEMAIKYQRKIEGGGGGEASSAVAGASSAAAARGGVMDTAGATYQSPLDRLSLGRRVLLKAGLDAQLAPRVLVGLFTYTLGALGGLQRLARHVSQRKQLVAALWRVYLSNLERSEPELYEWVARCVAAENARRESLRRGEHLVRCRALHAHVSALRASVALLSAQDASLSTLASDEARSMGGLGLRLRDMQHAYELGVERKSTVQTSIADWTIKSGLHIANCKIAPLAELHGGRATLKRTNTISHFCRTCSCVCCTLFCPHSSFEMESSVHQRQEGLAVLQSTREKLTTDISNLEARLFVLRHSVASEGARRAALGAAHTALVAEVQALERETERRSADLARMAEGSLVSVRLLQEEEARVRELEDVARAQDAYMKSSVHWGGWLRGAVNRKTKTKGGVIAMPWLVGSVLFFFFSFLLLLDGFCSPHFFDDVWCSDSLRTACTRI